MTADTFSVHEHLLYLCHVMYKAVLEGTETAQSCDIMVRPLALLRVQLACAMLCVQLLAWNHTLRVQQVKLCDYSASHVHGSTSFSGKL